MVYRFSFLLLACIVLVAAVASAGVKREPANKQIAPDATILGQVSQAAGQPLVAPTLHKTNSLMQVIGSSWYDYGWNSGSPNRIVYYDGRAYMIYIGRSSTSAPREITYVSYDAATFLTPVPVVPAATQNTYFSGIDVWRGGDANGLAAVAAGHTGSGNSYYAVEQSPGDGVFSASIASSDRDASTLSLDDMGTALYEDSKGRTDYHFQRTSDYGNTWTEVNTGAAATATGIPGGQEGGDLLDISLVKGPTGDVFFGACLAGVDNGPPFADINPDSADITGYFKSTDQGSTWAWTTIAYDGQEAIPGYFNLFENFSGIDLAVDGNNMPHALLNGYSLRAMPDSSKFTIDAIYWDPTLGFKSLVNFNRDLDIIDGPVIDQRADNALGCSYPTIAVSNDGQVIVCVWSQPNFTETSIDTASNGIITYGLWYNASFDGGNTWNGAAELAGVPGHALYFATLANDLEVLPGGNLEALPAGVRARVLYLDDPVPGMSLFGGTDASSCDWVYMEFDVTSTVDVRDQSASLPKAFALDQNYPNPFNPSTKITYSIPVKADVSLRVYNTLGQEVATLVNDFREAGTYNVDFSAANLTSGVYFYTLKAGQFAETKKMMMVK